KDERLVRIPRCDSAPLQSPAEFRFAAHRVIWICSIWPDILIKSKAPTEDCRSDRHIGPIYCRRVDGSFRQVARSKQQIKVGFALYQPFWRRHFEKRLY